MDRRYATMPLIDRTLMRACHNQLESSPQMEVSTTDSFRNSTSACGCRDNTTPFRAASKTSRSFLGPGWTMSRADAGRTNVSAAVPRWFNPSLLPGSPRVL
jgi:hypothetical protein